MKTIPITEIDFLEIKTLWDNNKDDSFIYSPLTKEQFNLVFNNYNDDYSSFSYKGVLNDELIGLAAGIFYPSRNTFYITMVLVDKKYRNKGYGKKLVKALENFWLNKPIIKKVDMVFLNPANLVWQVPQTDGHEHPNMPGVDLQSSAHVFFKNLGFLDFTYQNSYYKNIENYEYPADILKRKEDLFKQGYDFVFYNQNKHHGLKELMIDLDSEGWSKEVLGHVKEKGDKNTLLVATYNDLVVGFTGPIWLQENGRGYFAGIAIHSKYRAHGLGTVLFARLCMGFKEIGAKYSTLFTAENNPARKIYERAGFKISRAFVGMRKETKR